MIPTHYDLVVVLAVLFSVQLAGLTFIAWLAWSSSRRSQDLTRAVGALVIQEANKIRALVSETR